MSHGHSSVNLSSLTSMFPESGIYDAYDFEGDDSAGAHQVAPDTLSSSSPQTGATLLSALDPNGPKSGAPTQSSGLFDLSDEMLFAMMGDSNGDDYGVDPTVSFGGYNSYSPHWKTDSSSTPTGTSSDSAMQDALMNKIAAADPSQIHRRKLQ